MFWIVSCITVETHTSGNLLLTDEKYKLDSFKYCIIESCYENLWHETELHYILSHAAESGLVQNNAGGSFCKGTVDKVKEEVTGQNGRRSC